MKKVLLISYHFPPKMGGLENLIFNTWKSLNEKHEVFTLIPYAKDRGDDPPNVFRSPVPGLLFYFMFVFLKGFWLMAKHNCDVILSGSGLTSYLTIILAKLFRAASVTIVLGLDITFPHPLYRAMITFFLRRNDAIVSISDSTTSKAVSVGVSPDIITKIHPGVDYESFQIGKSQEELKSKYDLDGRRVILNAGRLAKRKGALEFVRYCMPSIVQEVPDAMFLLVGANPTQSLAHKENMAMAVQNEVKKLGLEKHVRMVGKVDQESLVEYYNLCDIFVLPVIPVPGDAEGFGIVCIEAAAAGKPVVGTDIGGIPDSVEKGKSGMLLPPNDHKGLASEIIDLLNDTERRNSMGEYGKRRARDGFDWDIVGNQYVELVNSIGNKRS